MLSALITLSSSVWTKFYGNRMVVLISMYIYIGGYQVGLNVRELFPSNSGFVCARQESILGLNIRFAIFAIITSYMYDPSAEINSSC